MAEKRVIEYEAASELANDDWLLIDGVTEGTRKARPSTVTAELGEQVTNIATAVSGLTQVAMGHEQSFAPDYDESESYDVGDLVMQYHGLYKCTAATTGTWDAGKWARTEVSEQLEESGKIDDVQVNGVSVVTDKVASIDLTDMQADIDSKQADTKIGGASILDNNKVANLDFLASYGEASGSIASFNDGAAMPLKSLKVGIEATQNLHGYDYPWPAGGGKNKFNTTASSGTAGGVIYTVNDDGSITVSGTATAGTAFGLGRARVNSSMGNVTISGIATATNISFNNISLYDSENNVIATISSGTTASSVTFDLSSYANAYSISISVKRRDNGACSGIIKPQVEIGSTATSFAPYKNECPITGKSAVNEYRHGKNFFDASSVTIADITFEDSGGTTITKSGFIYHLPAGSYSAKCFSEDVQSYIYLRIHDKDGHYIDRKALSTTDEGGWRRVSFTLNNGDYIIVYAAGAYITLTSTHMLCIQTDTVESYTAYNGTTYTTTLKDGQNNPYEYFGCELVNTNGSQKVNKIHNCVDLGDYTWAKTTNAIDYVGFYTDITDKLSRSDLDLMCSSYVPTNKSRTQLNDGELGFFNTNTGANMRRLMLRNDNFAEYTEEQVKTALSGVQYYYTLATQEEITQDNLTIASGEGGNNLWCDTGDILECKYVRDNSAVINDLIARVTALENA